MEVKKTVAIERFIASALSFVGFKEEAGNRGQVVERFLKETGLPGGYAWCCAFVYHAGYWSQYNEVNKKSAWPLPATAGCKDLGASAAKLGMLQMFPDRGDIFLKYSAKEGKFSHTGIVLSAKISGDGRYDCITVEGNTNDSGAREGDSVLIRPRVLDTSVGDRFVRWSLRL